MAMVVYSGNSLLDGTPIVMLATFESSNSKTGGMTQTHIVRADMTPADAIRSGADSAVCGECPHRINRDCYTHGIILRGNGTASTYRSFERGNAKPFDIRPFVGKPLRMGTYGDPAAIPFEVWLPLIDAANTGRPAGRRSNHTGYTHQWRNCDQRYRTVCMASCDSDTDVRDANAMGWDTYRVHAVGTERPAGSKPCPSSKEMGAKLTCADCLRCAGTSTGLRGNNIAIMSHGAGANKFREGTAPVNPMVPAATGRVSLPLTVVATS